MNIFYNTLKKSKVLAIKELLKVRTTNDKILEAYVIEDNGSEDGIWYNETDRNSTSPITAGTEITGTRVIKRSEYSGESVINMVLDSNHLDHPSGYIISLCFWTFDGTTSKLYMGRVSSGAGVPKWTKCADTPRVYTNSEILSLHSSFVNVDGGKPIKIVQIKNLDSGDTIIIYEAH